MEFPFEIEIGDMSPALLFDSLEEELWLDGYVFQYFETDDEIDPKTGEPLPYADRTNILTDALIRRDQDGAIVANVMVRRLRLSLVRMHVFGVSRETHDQFGAALEAALVTFGWIDAAGGDGVEETGNTYSAEDAAKRYWLQVVRQAEASGNVSRYLADREISSTTYYDNKKRHGL